MNQTGTEAEEIVAERMCIVTREVMDEAQLIRFVRGPDGSVVPDLNRKLPGRGVWVGLKRTRVAEAVKIALVKDAAFFGWIEANAAQLRAGEPEPLEQLVRRCAQLHLEHIAGCGDPFETGSARPLDYGHWAAHKLESLTHNRLRHGEAVAIGMALDTLYAAKTGRLAAASAERVLALLSALGLPRSDAALEGADALLNGLEEFREHLGGELSVTLLEDIGRGVDVASLDPAVVRQCLAQLEGRA